MIMIISIIIDNFRRRVDGRISVGWPDDVFCSPACSRTLFILLQVNLLINLSKEVSFPPQIETLKHSYSPNLTSGEFVAFIDLSPKILSSILIFKTGVLLSLLIMITSRFSPQIETFAP